MRIDLHCHSTHSDGSLPAHQVAERAFAREVQLFCLTDHDSCSGYDATRAAYPNALEGVELSCSHDDRSVHLLIYKRASSTSWPVLLDALEEQKEARRERVRRIAERLAPLGVALDAEALLETHAGTTIGRPHIAAELVKIGAVSSRSEAFDRYLKDGGPGDVVVSNLSLPEGLALGMAAGGCMSLAHPHVHGNRAEGIVRDHKDQGLTGLEVFYGQYKSKSRKNWADLADEQGLVQTGGSDFHGETLPQVTRLGVDVPDSVGESLLSWLEISKTPDN
jgi:predicted metal-dependent phosphoesterase TrpH